MKCAINELLSILPPKIGTESRQYMQSLLEIRVRVHQKIQFVLPGRMIIGNNTAEREDLQFILNTASRYSPWSSATISDGYITALGGHRIGITGQAAIKDSIMCTIRQPMSLCIRVAREFPGIADTISNQNGNILLMGPPGSGKTTMLRDLIRSYSNKGKGSICVVDEREELFPVCQDRYVFDTGGCTDILSGCSKYQGILTALRTMGPACIAVDEITHAKDCAALVQAGWCGVRLFATIHASNIDDLMLKPIFKKMLQDKLFDYAVILALDKSYTVERIAI